MCLLVEDDPYEMESGIQSVGQSVSQKNRYQSVCRLSACLLTQLVSQ